MFKKQDISITVKQVVGAILLVVMCTSIILMLNSPKDWSILEIVGISFVAGFISSGLFGVFCLGAAMIISGGFMVCDSICSKWRILDSVLLIGLGILTLMSNMYLLKILYASYMHTVYGG